VEEVEEESEGVDAHVGRNVRLCVFDYVLR
jgi:hypothetical protein